MLKVPRTAIAAEAFSGESEGELSFPAGAQVLVSHVSAISGWCKGRLSFIKRLDGVGLSYEEPVRFEQDVGDDDEGVVGWFPLEFLVDSDALISLGDDAFVETEDTGDPDVSEHINSAHADSSDNPAADTDGKPLHKSLELDFQSESDSESEYSSGNTKAPRRPLPIPPRKPLAARTSVTVASEDAPRRRAPTLPMDETLACSNDQNNAQHQPNGSRHNIVKELVETEHSYLRALILCSKHYLVPLRASGIVDQGYLDTIFANIEVLIAINTNFFGRIDSRVEKWSRVSTIGDVFLAVLEPTHGDRERHSGDGPVQSEFVSAYKTYMRCHAQSILTFNREIARNKLFATFVSETRETHSAELSGLDLLALLIMPVQRLLRYRLLIQDILKQTSGDHEDRAPLTKALALVGQLAAEVNDAIKEQENIAKLGSIEDSFSKLARVPIPIVVPGRQFVREGTMTKASRKRDQDRTFFLFSDLLIYASNVERSVSSRFSRIPGVGSDDSSPIVSSAHSGIGFSTREKKQYLFNRALNLLSMDVEEAETPASVRDKDGRFYFSIRTREEKSFSVFVRSESERTVWLTDLRKWINECRLSSQDTISNARSVAPIWIQDREVKTCMICDKRFTVTSRRHHCRNCGAVVCSDCSNFRLRLPHTGDKVARVCSSCWRDKAPDKLMPQETRSKRLSTDLASIAGGILHSKHHSSDLTSVAGNRLSEDISLGSVPHSNANSPPEKVTRSTVSNAPPLPAKKARSQHQEREPSPSASDDSSDLSFLKAELESLRSEIASMRSQLVWHEKAREEMVTNITAAVLARIATSAADV